MPFAPGLKIIVELGAHCICGECEREIAERVERLSERRKYDGFHQSTAYLGRVAFLRRELDRPNKKGS